MFVSGNIYHDVLVEWAMRLARAIPERQIIYKLHPNRQHSRRAIRRQLASYNNIENEIDASVSARAWLPRAWLTWCSFSRPWRVEALQTGRRLCILPFSHYRTHKDLFALGAVCVTPSIDHLVKALDTPPDSGGPPKFFESFDAVAARALLRELSVKH